MDNTNEVMIKIKPDTSELDDAINKAKQLNDLLNEAMKLAGSIANTNLNIRISSEFDGNATELACITTELFTKKQIEKKLPEQGNTFPITIGGEKLEDIIQGNLAGMP